MPITIIISHFHRLDLLSISKVQSFKNIKNFNSSEPWPYGFHNRDFWLGTDRLQPESVSQSVTTDSHEAMFAVDNDLSTYSLASVSSGEIWFKVEFSQSKDIFGVQVYQEFYKNWFYCNLPEDYCRLSSENYRVRVLTHHVCVCRHIMDRDEIKVCPVPTWHTVTMMRSFNAGDDEIRTE